MPNINKIKLSGTSYDIQDANATKTVELTQAQYDALVTGGTVDSNTFYVITDGEMFNPSGKVDTSAFTEFSGSVETALSGKQDTLSAGTNITIVDNVISAEGGGGKAISAGTNISVTTGETADTINCTLPITINSNKTTILPNNANNTANGNYNFIGGRYCQITNYAGGGYPDYAFCHGYYNTVTTQSEAAFGQYNQTKNAAGAQGITGTSIFTIGNGDWISRRHNALEVMQNGDIYIADTNDTSTSNYWQKPMIKLQDALGGGGIDSGTVQTMIDESISGKTDESAFTAHTADTTIHVTTAQTASWDGAVSDISTISGDVVSLSGDVATVSGAIPSTYVSSIAADSDGGYQRFYRFSTPSNFNYFLLNNAKINNRAILSTNWGGFDTNFSLVETSAITTSVTSSSTDAQVPSAKAVNDKLGGLSLVKLTQAEYDALSPDYDSNTLYVING